LFTVLGEFVLPAGETAWTSAFIDIFGRLGVEEKAARQALMRTAADGWLVSVRVGRRTMWRLTPAAERLLVDGTERIFGFGGPAGQDWDGRWLLVLARAPETERSTRHLLRTRLSWAGLGSPAPGVWVSPHAARLDEVRGALKSAGVAGAQVFVGSHGGHGDLRELVRQAWDLEDIEARYAAFIERFSARTRRDELTATVELVHAWRRFPWIDPSLPASLLPRPWSGVAAARLFARQHDRWSPGARAAWQDLNTAEG
jgi:phenylacetic acid degradation operon negative regulatory protein